ncbi:MAG: SPOR domain-containing protein [Tenuifilaceae bacterium]
MEINLIIRELLAKHTFISLPGIGSFIQKYEPAHLLGDGKTFAPPTQLISFDVSRNFNDEAIENFIVEKLKVDHSRATELVNEFINSVNQDLSSGKEVNILNVGVLTKDKNGQISFTQSQDLASSTFGLKEFAIETTASEKSKVVKKEEKKPIPVIKPQKKSNTTKILVGIAAILAIAVITTTFILIPELRFWNKLTESSELSSTPVVQTKTDDSNPKEETITPISIQENIKDTIKLKVNQTITDKNEKKAALYYEEPKPQENKTFYLIVGSFGKMENAQKLSENYSQKGFNTEIIEGNNMFRVSLLKTLDKSEALRELNKFRSENPNEAVWVLGI